MKKVNTYGLTNEEYIALLKECNMDTKKWTLSRWKEFNKKRLEILYKKKGNKKPKEK